MKRYHVLDGIRGITLCSMILYHVVWDLVYIFDYNWDWYRSDFAYVWQQSICWCFILLSGFCFSLGKRKVRRGLIVFGAGALVSFVTHITMPGQSVSFGVLTMLGSSMLLMACFEKIYKEIGQQIDTGGVEKTHLKNDDKNIRAYSGMAVFFSFFCFLITRGINERYLGFEEIYLFKLPDTLYQNGNLMTYIGFMSEDFYSTDYFSMIPWFFLFLTGYFLFHWMKSRGTLDILKTMTCFSRFFCFIGKRSLIIYLIHQPIAYTILAIFNKI